MRDPGFPASRGGQLKLNVTRRFEKGFARIYGKYLNDSNVFYLPLPFQAGGDFVEGFPDNGTLTTAEGNFVNVPRPRGEGPLVLPLENGQRQVGGSVLLELFLELGKDWTLENKARVMNIDHTWNALLPFDLVDPDEFAAQSVPSGGRFEYSFTNHDEPFSTVNDLLLTAGLWHVRKPVSSFANQLQFSRRFETGSTKHNLALGAYFAHYRAGNTWYFTDILTDVRDNPKFVDLTVFDAAGNSTSITSNGFRSFGSLYVNGRGNADVFALFAGDELELTERLRLDLGGRFEFNQFRQNEELTTSFDLGDPATLADDAVTGGTGRFRHESQSFIEWALSAGVNYMLSDNVAIWGRASRGYKMPILDNSLFGGQDLQAEQILQFEFGTKIGTPQYGINTSAYLQRIEDFPSQDARVVDGETVFVTDFVGQARTLGLEIEGVTRPVKGVQVDLRLTAQQPEYTDFVETQEDFSGNRIRRLPELIVDLTGAYTFLEDKARISANWNFIGDRFSNNANTIELPSFSVFNLRGAYRISSTASLNIAVHNVFGSDGLTEGNPRLDEDAVAAGLRFLARPVLPTRATVGLEFRF